MTKGKYYLICHEWRHTRGERSLTNVVWEGTIAEWMVESKTEYTEEDHVLVFAIEITAKEYKTLKDLL